MKRIFQHSSDAVFCLKLFGRDAYDPFSDQRIAKKITDNGKHGENAGNQREAVPDNDINSECFVFLIGDKRNTGGYN